MPPTREEVESLKAKVSAAFAEVPRPPAGELVQCACRECEGVAKSFAGVGWREVSPQVLEDNYDMLPLFSPAAFRHFLPAYMLYSLEHFEFEGVCEYTLYALTPGKEAGDSAAYYGARLAPLTPGQADVVREFLALARREEAFARHHTSIERGGRRLEKYYPHGAAAAGRPAAGG